MKMKKKKIFGNLFRCNKTSFNKFSFFKGLTDGKLLFSSVIENDFSSSKLKIENLK